MRYLGHVKGGVVIVDGDLSLAEGTPVAVEPLAEDVAAVAPGQPVPTLLERFGDLVGSIKDLPEDFALNHDHYIHGTPKKYPTK